MCTVYSRHLLGGGDSPPPKKNLQFPQTAAKLCALNFFLRLGQSITNMSWKCHMSYVALFFQWTVNTGNHSSLNNQEDADLCRKCIKIRMAVGLCLDPLGSVCTSPDPLAAMGTTSKGDGRQERGDGNDGKGIPQSQGE